MKGFDARTELQYQDTMHKTMLEDLAVETRQLRSLLEERIRWRYKHLAYRRAIKDLKVAVHKGVRYDDRMEFFKVLDALAGKEERRKR